MMRTLSLAATLCLLLATLTGCEETTAGGASATAPRILSFWFTPVKVFVGETVLVEADIDFEDSDGNVSELVIRIHHPDGTVTPDATLPLVAGGLTEGSLEVSFELEADTVGEFLLEIELVDEDGQHSDPKDGDLEVADYGNVANVCGAQDTTCESSSFCYNVDPSSCEYLDEHLTDLDACQSVPDANQAVCVSSLEDPDAEYAAESQCEFIQYWHNPTSLYADCRCGTSAVDVTVCKDPESINVEFGLGEGPRFRNVSPGFNDVGQGPVIGREWFLPYEWSSGTTQNQAMVFAMNLDTGDRRHVSGTHVDPQLGTAEVDSGDPFSELYHLVEGPDGLVYGVGGTGELADPMIWSIHPTTGARELVYDAGTIDEDLLCPNGNLNVGTKQLQMHPGSMAIDPNGDFYLSGTATNLPGPCIVKIDADTGACSYVTAVIFPNTLNSFEEHIGEGYDLLQFPFRGLEWHDGKIYAISDTKFVEIDPESGQRLMISNAKTTGGYGSGPISAEGMGDYWTRFDPHQGVFFTVGGGKVLVIAIEPETGDRHSMPCWHPTLGILDGGCNTTGRFTPGALDRGGFTFDPDDPRHLFFAHTDIAVVKYDKWTSNTVIWSL